MKKRNLTAIGLVLALLLGTASPVLAAEPAPAQLAEESEGYLAWDEFMYQYMEEHPEHYESFDADTYFAGTYGDWYTKEEYMADVGLETEEDFKEDMWWEWLLSDGIYSNDALYDEVDAAYGAYILDFYESGHPGELDGLRTEDLLAWRGYTETLTPMEQYGKDWELDSEEAVRRNLLKEYARDRLRVEELHADFLAYQAAWPEKWADFDADDWFAEGHSFDEKEEYMNTWSLRTEEEFQESMFVDYVESNYWYWELEENGGYTPWQGEEEQGECPLALVVNGFPVEAELTAEDGVSYLPAKAANEILGTAYAEGPVAIRAAAQAAGWDVAWNSRNNEVVLLDREALMGGVLLTADELEEMLADEDSGAYLRRIGELEGNYIKQDFSRFDELMNRLLSGAETKAGQSCRTTENCDLTLTAFNSLDGDKTYAVHITADVLVRDNIIDMTLTANAGELLSLLSQPTLDKLAAEMPKVTLQNLKTLLTGCKAEVILNLEEGRLYWNIPLLAAFDDMLNEDTWYSLDLGLAEEGTAAWKALADQKWNTGALLYEMLLAESESGYWGAEYAYGEFLRGRAMAYAIAGPQTVAEENGALTWHMDADSLGQMLAIADGEWEAAAAASQLFREMGITVCVDQSGKFSSAMVLRLDMDALAGKMTASPWYEAGETALMTWVLNLLDFRVSAQASGTAAQASGAAQFHWKNQFKLDVESGSSREAVDKEPRTAPPAGAEIIEL